MRLTYFKVLILLFITTSLSYGCAAKQTLSKTSLEGKGIVVARIVRVFYSSSFGGLEDYLNGKVYIDGDVYEEAIENGYLALSLKPGKHSLDKITVQGVSVQNTIARKVIKHYPVKQDFEIKPGYVTNLGRLLLIMDRKEIDRYTIVSIDNTQQIITSLKANRPEIYGDLEPTRFITNGKFADDKLLAALRNQFAAYAIKKSSGLTQRTANSFIAYGPLGTMMEMKLDVGKKKVTSKTLLDTNTYDRITSCASKALITACFTTSEVQQTAYIYDGKTLVRSLLPAGTNYRKVYIEHDKGIIFLGDDLSIMRYRDLGKTWKREDRFKVETDEPSTLRAAAVAGGFYAYTSLSSRVLYYSATTGAFSRLPETDEVSTANIVLPTATGVYLMPENSSFSDSKLLFLKPGADKWRVLDISTNGCSKIRTLDKGKGVHLEIECKPGRKNIILQSQDAGKSWVIGKA